MLAIIRLLSERLGIRGGVRVRGGNGALRLMVNGTRSAEDRLIGSVALVRLGTERAIHWWARNETTFVDAASDGKQASTLLGAVQTRWLLSAYFAASLFCPSMPAIRRPKLLCHSRHLHLLN